MLSLVLVLSLVLAPRLSFAGDKHCDPQDRLSCVQTVTEGVVVPFSGQLMTHRRAAKLVGTTEQCNDARALDLEEAHELFQIQLDLLKKQRANDQEAAKLKLDLMTKRMQQMEKELSPEWYERPVFVASVAVMLTVGVFMAAVKTVEALK